MAFENEVFHGLAPFENDLLPRAPETHGTPLNIQGIKVKFIGSDLCFGQVESFNACISSIA